MSKEITFDKFIRWAGIVTLVIAVLYITNYLSEVLLPSYSMVFRIPALSRREVHRAKSMSRFVPSPFFWQWELRLPSGGCHLAHHPSDD